MGAAFSKWGSNPQEECNRSGLIKNIRAQLVEPVGVIRG
jgi:hypothetical protein